MRHNVARRAVVPAVLAVAGAAVAAISSPAGAVAHRQVAKQKPSSTFSGALAVPHTTDVWVVGSKFYPPKSTTESGTVKVIVKHLHHGHWSTRLVPSPKNTSVVAVVGATTSKVWLEGYSSGYRIYRLAGRKLKPVTLPRAAKRISISGIFGSTLSNVWVIGNVSDSSGSSVPRTFHWNGKHWSAKPVPAAGTAGTTVSALSTSASDNAAMYGQASVGEVVFRWNGHKWSDTHLPAPSQPLSAISTGAPGKTYLAGTVTGSDSQPHPMVDKHDGQKWSQTTLSSRGYVYGAGSLGSLAFLTGFIPAKTTSGRAHPLIARSNGGAFKAMSSPNAGSGLVLGQVSVASKHLAVLLGNYTPKGASCDKSHSVIELYNGHKWSIVTNVQGVRCG